MQSAPSRQLRVLVADERLENLERVARIVTQLGHVVVARETDIAAVAALSEQDVPDVAIVAVGENSEHALGLITTIVREATCPVIALLDAEDLVFIRQAAKRGVFAYISNGDVSDEQLDSAIEVVLHRFAEYHALEGAFGRRAITERAKGILMERHQVDEETAYAMLRDHARRTNQKLLSAAEAVLAAHALLPDTATQLRD
jgi:AmiR/NasT family two-component response regulator